MPALKAATQSLLLPGLGGRILLTSEYYLPANTGILRGPGEPYGGFPNLCAHEKGTFSFHHDTRSAFPPFFHNYRGLFMGGTAEHS